MIFHNENFQSNVGTFISEDLDKALDLARAILALNEGDNLGERSVLLSMEDNWYRVDSMWTSYDGDGIVYCSTSDLNSMIDAQFAPDDYDEP